MAEPAPTATFTAIGPGTHLGKYRLAERLGVGGMGVVYAAEHLRLGRRVAVKLLKPEFGADSTQAKRFQAEARLVSSLGHPNIVEVYDYGQLPDGCLYYVMELLDGQTLQRRLAQRPLSDAELLAVFAPLLSAVQAAHQVGAVHRDLRPENVMLVGAADPQAPLVKLMDFGVAKIRSESAAATSLATESRVVMGTVQDFSFGPSVRTVKTASEEKASSSRICNMNYRN